jgi:hypothetical protein
MQASMPSARVKEWHGAHHSIHNTDRDAVVAELKQIVLDATSALSRSTA